MEHNCSHTNRFVIITESNYTTIPKNSILEIGKVDEFGFYLWLRPDEKEPYVLFFNTDEVHRLNEISQEAAQELMLRLENTPEKYQFAGKDPRYNGWFGNLNRIALCIQTIQKQYPDWKLPEAEGE